MEIKNLEHQNKLSTDTANHYEGVTEAKFNWFNYEKVAQEYEHSKLFNQKSIEDVQSYIKTKNFKRSFKCINNYKFVEIVDILRKHFLETKTFKLLPNMLLKKISSESTIDSSSEINERRITDIKAKKINIKTRKLNKENNYYFIEYESKFSCYEISWLDIALQQRFSEKVYIGGVDHSYRVWVEVLSDPTELKINGSQKIGIAANNNQIVFQLRTGRAISIANYIEETLSTKLPHINIFNWIHKVLGLSNQFIVLDRVDIETFYTINGGQDLMTYMLDLEATLKDRAILKTTLAQEFHIKTFIDTIRAFEKLLASGIVYTDIKPENLTLMKIENKIKISIIDTEDIVTIKILMNNRAYPIKFTKPYVSEKLHTILVATRNKFEYKWLKAEDYQYIRELFRVLQTYSLITLCATCYSGGIIYPEDSKCHYWLKRFIVNNIKKEYQEIVMNFMVNPSLESGKAIPLLSDMAEL